MSEVPQTPISAVADSHAAYDPDYEPERRDTYQAARYLRQLEVAVSADDSARVARKTYRPDIGWDFRSEVLNIEAPTECHFCGTAPHHPAKSCPTLASLGALRRRLREVEASKPETNQRDWHDLVWQLQQWEAHVQERKQLALGSRVAADAENDYSPAPCRSTLCSVPDEFYALNLPAKGQGPADPRRLAVGMTPHWPWYPPPPPISYEDQQTVATVDMGFPSEDDRQLAIREKRKASWWQGGLDSFLQRYHAQKAELERLEQRARSGSQLSADAQRTLEHDVRAWIDPIGINPETGRDPELPPQVRDVKWHYATAMDFEGGLLPNGKRLWLFSNVAWYSPPPSAFEAVVRLDGRYGEHEYSELPQWYQRRHMYRAYCEGGYYANLDSRRHSDMNGDFAWYELKTAQFNISWGIANQMHFQMPNELVASMDSSWERLEQGITYWQARHPHINDYPHQSEHRVRSAMRILKTQALDERSLRVNLLGCQRNMRDLRGWIRWHRVLNKLLALKENNEELGTVVARRANAEDDNDGLLEVLGLWTTVEKIAILVGQGNAPVWFLHALPVDFTTDMPVPELVHPRFEQRQWPDGAQNVPLYILPIRQRAFAPERSDAQPEPELAPENDDALFHPPRRTPYTRPQPLRVAVPDNAPLPDYDDANNDAVDLNMHVEPDTVLASGANATLTAVAATAGSSSSTGIASSSFSRGHKRRRDEDAQQDAQQDAVPATKRHRSKAKETDKDLVVRFVDTVPEQTWFPAAWGPSACGAAKIDLSIALFREAATRSDRPVPIAGEFSDTPEAPTPRALLERDMLHVRAPGMALLGKRSRPLVESAILRRYIAFRPYLKTSLESQPVTSASMGLPMADWVTLHKGSTDDAEKLADGRQLFWPERTRWWAEKVGLSALLKDKATAIDVPAVPMQDVLAGVGAELGAAQPVAQLPMIHYDPWDEVDWDEDLSGPMVPQQVGHYFHVGLPDDEQPLAPAHERALYQPRGFYWKGLNQERPYRDYTVWTERPCDHEPGTHEDAFDFYCTNSRDLQDLLPWRDVWVEFNTGDIYVLDRLGAEKDIAVGEQMFRWPVRYYEDNNYKEKFLKQRVGVRVWRGFDRNIPLQLSPDSLVELGSKATTRKFWLDDSAVAKLVGKGAFKLTAPPEPEPEIVAIPPPPPPPPSPPPAVKHRKTDEMSVDTGTSMRDLLDSIAGQLVWEDRVLPPWQPPTGNDSYIWCKDDGLKKAIARQMQRETWRLSVKRMDVMLGELFPSPMSLSGSTAERHEFVCAVWGGMGYTSTGPDPLTTANMVHRARALKAFHRLLQTWPTRNLKPFPTDAETDKGALEAIEAEIWEQFSQVYADFYRCAPPILPA